MLYYTFLLFSLEVSVDVPLCVLCLCHLALVVSVLPLGLCLQCTLHTSCHSSPPSVCCHLHLSASTTLCHSWPPLALVSMT